VKLRLAVLAVTVGLLASCGASETYSADETRDAFAQQDYALYEPSRAPPAGAAPDPYGSGKPTVLLPRGGEPFVVFVFRVTDAEEVWSRYESQQGAGAFDVRRANVIVISDSGLSSAQRERVKAALEAFPDRGSPVVVAGAD